MKILQINAVYGYSSTGRTTMDLHRALIEYGHQSYVISSEMHEKYKENDVFYLQYKFENKIHAFLSRLTGLQGYFSFFSTKKIINKIDALNPEIVHLRNLHANYINIPVLLKYLAKKNIAVVITLHDCWFYTGHCCYYTEDNCFKWQQQCGSCPAKRKWNKSWFFDFSTKMLTDKKILFANIQKLAVIGVSDWITNEAKLSILKNAKIIKRIYNWIDLGVFHPKNTAILRKEYNSENSFVILGVSQFWTDSKGIEIFLKIAKRLTNDVIILVGSMENNQHLPSNVLNFPATSDTSLLANYYSFADVMLNPSIQETFGKVTAEAIACGTPVIVNNAAANPELVGDDCGFVVNENNIEEICLAIRTIKAKGKESYGEYCVNFAKKNFNKSILIDEYINLYESILNVMSAKHD